MARQTISIHALLAESDGGRVLFGTPSHISIHALLAESDPHHGPGQHPDTISIHALLAESDPRSWRLRPKTRYFYPRSPCGERQALGLPGWLRVLISIHALLAESDCRYPARCVGLLYFYPRSPCGERPVCWTGMQSVTPHFYPRSPCGERLSKKAAIGKPTLISIHALLAESDVVGVLATLVTADFYPRSPCGERLMYPSQCRTLARDFYPRSPCGERQKSRKFWALHPVFLSTLSLRRATSRIHPHCLVIHNFYPRSPCGERRFKL